MKHDVERSVEILWRTPGALRELLEGLPDEWTRANCGGETWSAYDVVGHLVHGERADWLPRVRWILAHGDSEPFPPFDRFAQFRECVGKSLEELLAEFEDLRMQGLGELQRLALDDRQLTLPGKHPALGAVTMKQLLATWVVHDLNHLAQISRTLAFQYKDEVGPWREYLTVLPR
ncbi:MAG: DinB family protein [Planctomycetaceae bacterium]|nr:DinB family protein [Planctomycetaceae bacterium]